MTKLVAGVVFRKPCAGGRAEQFAGTAVPDRLLYKNYTKKEFYVSGKLRAHHFQENILGNIYLSLFLHFLLAFLLLLAKFHFSGNITSIHMLGDILFHA